MDDQLQGREAEQRRNGSGVGSERHREIKGREGCLPVEIMPQVTQLLPAAHLAISSSVD